MKRKSKWICRAAICCVLSIALAMPAGLGSAYSVNDFVKVDVAYADDPINVSSESPQIGIVANQATVANNLAMVNFGDTTVININNNINPSPAETKAEATKSETTWSKWNLIAPWRSEKKLNDALKDNRDNTQFVGNLLGDGVSLITTITNGIDALHPEWSATTHKALKTVTAATTMFTTVIAGLTSGRPLQAVTAIATFVFSLINIWKTPVSTISTGATAAYKSKTINDVSQQIEDLRKEVTSQIDILQAYAKDLPDQLWAALNKKDYTDFLTEWRSTDINLKLFFEDLDTTADIEGIDYSVPNWYKYQRTYKGLKGSDTYDNWRHAMNSYRLYYDDLDCEFKEIPNINNLYLVYNQNGNTVKEQLYVPCSDVNSDQVKDTLFRIMFGDSNFDESEARDLFDEVMNGSLTKVNAKIADLTNQKNTLETEIATLNSSSSNSTSATATGTSTTTSQTNDNSALLTEKQTKLDEVNKQLTKYNNVVLAQANVKVFKSEALDFAKSNGAIVRDGNVIQGAALFEAGGLAEWQKSLSYDNILSELINDGTNNNIYRNYLKQYYSSISMSVTKSVIKAMNTGNLRDASGNLVTGAKIQRIENGVIEDITSSDIISDFDNAINTVSNSRAETIRNELSDILGGDGDNKTSLTKIDNLYNYFLGIVGCNNGSQNYDNSILWNTYITNYAIDSTNQAPKDIAEAVDNYNRYLNENISFFQGVAASVTQASSYFKLAQDYYENTKTNDRNINSQNVKFRNILASYYTSSKNISDDLNLLLALRYNEDEIIEHVKTTYPQSQWDSEIALSIADAKRDIAETKEKLKARRFVIDTASNNSITTDQLVETIAKNMEFKSYEKEGAAEVTVTNDNGDVIKTERFLSFADAWYVVNALYKNNSMYPNITIKLNQDVTIDSEKGVITDNSIMQGRKNENYNKNAASGTYAINFCEWNIQQNITLDLNDHKITNSNPYTPNIIIDNVRYTNSGTDTGKDEGNKDPNADPYVNITIKHGTLNSIDTGKDSSGKYQVRNHTEVAVGGVNFEGVVTTPAKDPVDSSSVQYVNGEPVIMTGLTAAQPAVTAQSALTLKGNPFYISDCTFSNYATQNQSPINVGNSEYIETYNKQALNRWVASFVRCSFTDCSRTSSTTLTGDAVNANGGGAISVKSCDFKVMDCDFVNCKSDGSGGAINIEFMDNGFNNAGSQTPFIGFNTDSYSGNGRLELDVSRPTATNFINCSTQGDGGAIYTTERYTWINGANFVACNANKCGGAISNNCKKDYSKKGSLLAKATASDGAYATHICNSNFIGNRAEESGGAVWISAHNPHTEYYYTEFYCNQAGKEKGNAIFNGASNIAGNECTIDGAFYTVGNGTGEDVNGGKTGLRAVERAGVKVSYSDHITQQNLVNALWPNFVANFNNFRRNMLGIKSVEVESDSSSTSTNSYTGNNRSGSLSIRYPITMPKEYTYVSEIDSSKEALRQAYCGYRFLLASDSALYGEDSGDKLFRPYSYPATFASLDTGDYGVVLSWLLGKYNYKERELSMSTSVQSRILDMWAATNSRIITPGTKNSATEGYAYDSNTNEYNAYSIKRLGYK